MTVLDAGSGSGRRKRKAETRRFLGVFRFKMNTIREVMKRRMQVARLVKRRMEKRTSVREEEMKEAWLKAKCLDLEIAKKRKEIEEMIKKARVREGDEPIVKVRIQVTYPGKKERGKQKTFLMKENQVTKENLDHMGLPAEIESSVKNIQNKLESVRIEHRMMIKEANNLLKTIQRLDI